MDNFYFVALSNKIDREQIINWLTSKGAIQRWFYNMNGTLFVKSNLNAKELSRLIIEKFGKERHFVVKVIDDRAGILPKDHWKIFYEE